MVTSGRDQLRRNSLASQRLFDRACAVMPGGNTRTTVFTPPHPVYAARGYGSRVVDVDGIERIDFINNFTALIHGHAHPVLVAAACAQLEKGSCFGLPTESEIVLAEKICARVASIDEIRFANSGTEAVMMAIKAARAFTGRPKILKAEGAYHGSYDDVEVSQDSSPSNWGEPGRPAATAYSAGMPARVLGEVLVVPFNDAEVLTQIVAANHHDLAAIIIDPMPARAGLIPATAEFLRAARELCDRFGIVLISDEIISFRIGYGGPQERFGFSADLTTLGKIIGGGFPVGAVGGRRDIMAVFDPRLGKPKVPHGGTFNANPMTMVAGAAALELLTPAAFAALEDRGDALRAAAEAAFRDAGIDGQATGQGSLLRLHVTGRRLRNYRDCYPTPTEKLRQSALYQGLLDCGIIVAPNGLMAVSTVTTDDDVAAFGTALQATLKRPEFAARQPDGQSVS
jgi:glutamate-1-semialdehyde 2,1-aminomutase